MRVRRSRLTTDFVQLPNGAVRDSRLSYMARGILAELLSRPDGWECTADSLWRQSSQARDTKGEGRRAFRDAFAELKLYGYITVERRALDAGRVGTELTVHDTATTDVPHAGTPVPPAETSKAAGGTDVPPTDVPHAGTSKEENGRTNTGEKNTSSSALPAQQQAEDLAEFGHFWIVHPKARDRAKTLAAWREAVAAGADPKAINAAATAYARERAGEPLQYTKLSHTWLRDGRYLDRYDPEPTHDGRPQLRAVPSDFRSRQQQDTDDLFNRAMARATAKETS